MIDVVFRRTTSLARADDPTKQCTFCCRDIAAIRHLVAGPGVSICDECTDLAAKTLRSHGSPEFRAWWQFRRRRTRDANHAQAYRSADDRCTFCRRTADFMIRAEHAFICSPCVKLARDVVNEHVETRFGK
jgi:ATP-dependent protease Clp ATPase subunit